MKKVALFDFDKTIYNSHSFFQLAEYEVHKGRIKRAVWDEIQKLLLSYKSEEFTYSVTANKLLATFAKSLQGQSYKALYDDCLEFFSNNPQNFHPYFEKILPKLKETYDIFIVTTNAQFVADFIVKRFQLSGYISSEFEVHEGLFTGKVIKSLGDGKDVVSGVLKKYGREGSIAVGDSENDIGMLELVEHPVCISPNEKLKEHALKNKWGIVEVEDAESYFLRLLKV